MRDTVELWRLPNQRKISLRFLASYVLKEDIQVGVFSVTVAVTGLTTLLIIVGRSARLYRGRQDRHAPVSAVQAPGGCRTCSTSRCLTGAVPVRTKEQLDHRHGSPARLSLHLTMMLFFLNFNHPLIVLIKHEITKRGYSIQIIVSSKALR